MYKCSECGSINVQSKAWVNANTSEVIEFIDGELGWCEDCQDETSLNYDANYEEEN